MGGTPAKINAGSVTKLPPPATEFCAPPSTAATKSRNACGKVTTASLAGFRAALPPSQSCNYKVKSRHDTRPLAQRMYGRTTRTLACSALERVLGRRTLLVQDSRQD